MIPAEFTYLILTKKPPAFKGLFIFNRDISGIRASVNLLSKLNCFLKRFAGFKLWRVEFGNGNALGRIARIYANTGSAVAYAKLPKAGNIYLVAGP